MGENLIYLIEKCKKKDEDSISQALEMFEPLIRKYERLLDYEDARNDLWEQFIKILFSIPVCENEYAILCYIKKSMHHEYIRLSKRKQRLNDLEYLTDVFDDYGTAFNTTEHDTYMIRTAVNKLTDAQRKVIVLKFMNGYQVNEIARMMGISRQAVNQNERRALDKLRETLK